MPVETKLRVWDPLVRLFHWCLVSGFATAYISQEDYLSLHSLAGYLVAVLVLWRIVWGFVGPLHARFADFVRSPGVVWSYLKDTLALRSKRYLGHNPAGGVMVLLLLICLLLTTFSGMAVYAIGDQAGPLAGLMRDMGNQSWFVWQERFEEIHEFFAHFTLILIVVHVAGVIVESVVHHENLVRAMFDGRKRVEKIESTQEVRS